jgi:hypothetical protein
MSLFSFFRPDLIPIFDSLFELTALFLRLGVPSEKVAFVESIDEYEAKKSFFKKVPRKMKNFQILVYHRGIAVMRNNFIYGVTQDTVNNLAPNGIPQHFFNYVREVVFKPLPPDEREPQKFGFKDLDFGFYIHLICCAISLIVFGVEILYFNVKKLIGLRVLLNQVRFH